MLRNTRDIIEGYIRDSSYERPHYRAKGIYQALRSFQADVGPKVLLCVFRVSNFSPGGIFYAHEDFVHQAAQIIMADSALQEHRGFPNLIDIADLVRARGCSTPVTFLRRCMPFSRAAARRSSTSMRDRHEHEY